MLQRTLAFLALMLPCCASRDQGPLSTFLYPQTHIEKPMTKEESEANLKWFRENFRDEDLMRTMSE